MTSGQICGRFGENENVFCSGVKYWSFAQTWQPILYNVIYGAIAPLYTLIVIHRICQVGKYWETFGISKCNSEVSYHGIKSKGIFLLYLYRVSSISFLIYLCNESIHGARQDRLLISDIHEEKLKGKEKRNKLETFYFSIKRRVLHIFRIFITVR